jgi:hypothetical protein
MLNAQSACIGSNMTMFVVTVRETNGQETASSEWPLTLGTAWCGEWIDDKYRNPQEAT